MYFFAAKKYITMNYALEIGCKPKKNEKVKMKKLKREKAMSDG